MRDAIGRAAGVVEAAVERHRTVCFVLFAIVFFATFGLRAAYRPFWFDELFTYYVTTPPSASDVFKLLAQGVDQQPPPYYLLHRLFLAPAGEGDPLLWLRLPELLGVLLACWCVFEIVRRRASDFAAWTAVLLLVSSGAVPYAYEARPYGLVLGFTALAALAYQRATDGIARRRWLIALSCALFAAVSSSYYAVLAFFPFALAEADRLWTRRRVDWGVAAALGIAACFTAVYAPLAMGNVANFEVINWATPSRAKIAGIYATMAGQLPMSGMFLLIAWAAWAAVRGFQMENDAGESKGPSRRTDMVLGLGLLLLPFVLYVVAELVTHKMHWRYVVEAAVGFSVLAALWSESWMRRSEPLLRVAVVGILAVFLIQTETRAAIAIARAGELRPELARWLEEYPTPLPVAVDNPLANLQLAHDNPGGIRDRLYYVVDPENAQRLAPDIVRGGRNWLRNQEVMPIQAVPRKEFLAQHREFLLYRDQPWQSYLLTVCREEGAEIRLLQASAAGRGALYQIRYPLAGSESWSIPTESSTK